MGKEFVRQIASHYGWLDEIWAIARRSEALEELGKEIGIKVRVIPMDITDPKSIGKLKEMLREYKPYVKYLVNAAGCGVHRSVEVTSAGDCAGMIDLNCRALTEITRLFLPYMRQKSHIVMVASAAAFIPQPEFAVYAATKAYVLSFSRALFRELRGYIAVTIVCPGPVDTEFLEHIGGKKRMLSYKRRFIARPEAVVNQAILDAARKKEISIYGFSMKCFFILCKIVPHRVLLKIVEVISK
ncbi:SDR family NAD(P)-dependent oxidoreductase [Blautia sp. NSJ-175]|nr:SDR family NAD(P)-dependent oxidoreductase [Blautia sp. NSJ-175]